jgi:SAM-dependent methyltransferase
MTASTETAWWDEFSSIMAKQWKLTASMNGIVRSDYQHDYDEFLTAPGTRLLDIGCGTGWQTLEFARRGMVVDGIDISSGQLAAARAGAENEPALDAQFFQRDLINDSIACRFSDYDSAMVNSLLHHFSPADVDRVVRKIGAVLRPGGRVYFYEPLVPEPTSAVRATAFRACHYGFRAAFGAYQRWARWRGGVDAHFAEAAAQGYGGVTPDEKPVAYHHFETACRAAGFSSVQIRPYHYYSLNFCINLMKVSDEGRARFEPTAEIVYGLDRWLFRTFGWQNLDLRRGKFLFCGIRCIKN